MRRWKRSIGSDDERFIACPLALKFQRRIPPPPPPLPPIPHGTDTIFSSQSYRYVRSMDRLSDVPTLPQELIDHIIDFLERDRVSLRACALVSRSWSRRPHSLLWRAISIDGNYHIPPSSSFRTMLSAAPHIRNAIHTLKTRNLLNTNGLGDLISLLDSLPNLHSISLGFFFYCGLKGPIQPWRRTRPLRELRVDISKAITLEPHTIDFIPIIALFSKVPVLKLSLERTITASELSADLSWERRQLQPEEAELFKEWQLSEVDLCGEIPIISMDIIGSTQVQHLRSLTLPRIETSPRLARFITLAETAGAYVTHLRLNISRSGYEFIPTSDLRSKLHVPHPHSPSNY